MEIANELIPQIMKSESSGHSARSILKDPQCFAHLLRYCQVFIHDFITILISIPFCRFYDGICKWEEESQTPILHIGWAKPLVNTISKFDAEVRAQVNIVCHEDDDDKPIKHSTNEKTEDISNEPDPKKQGNGKEDDVKESVPQPNTVPRELSEEMEEVANSHPTTTLYSQKMKGLKNLLLSEKLNTHAISLHLTAQSQVFVNKKQKTTGDVVDQNVHCSIRPKRRE
jgi:menin